MKTNPDIAIWRNFNEMPTKSCDIIILGDKGEVCSGKYDKDKKQYMPDIKGTVVSKWMPSPKNIEEFIGVRENSYMVVEIVDPETDIPVGTLGGFLMMTKYNFEIIKSEEDMVKVADSFGQHFYEDILNIARGASR